jgi:hypothetical protein
MDMPPIAERDRSASPARVLFSSHEEFLEELRERGPNLEPLVRVTFRKIADGSGAPLAHLSLLATYLRRVDGGTSPVAVVTVVRLSEHLGSIWIDPTDQDSRRCQQRAGQLRAAVVRAATDLGLRVAGGAYAAGERDAGDGADPG